MLNIELAKKVLDYVEAHPEEHDQGGFIDGDKCGTTACIAGHAMLLSGKYRINFERTGGGPLIRSVVNEEAFVDYPGTAQALLGLDWDQRDELFFVLQDRDEALDYLRALIDEAEKTVVP